MNCEKIVLTVESFELRGSEFEMSIIRCRQPDETRTASRGSKVAEMPFWDVCSSKMTLQQTVRVKVGVQK